MPKSKKVYQLKVTLDGIQPPIWRRLLVGEDASLLALHDSIQKAMGWQGYHLHLFNLAGQIFGDPADDEFGDLGTKNETYYKLNKLGLGETTQFKYEYDFGDSWEHTIVVEKIIPAEKGTRYPMCLNGERACPPEDVGGIWRYEHFLKAISNPRHKEHDEYLAWIGGSFDPEEFDLTEANRRLRSVKPRHGSRISHIEPEDQGLDDPFPTGQQQAIHKNLIGWMDNLDVELSYSFERLPLRRDMLTVLDYISKNRVSGTPSTGNLPLKAVHAICAQFVNPPKLEQTIGGQTFKVRSEDQVWPLLFVHTLAFQSRLVDGGPARRWVRTAEGDSFSQLPPPIQVTFLFFNWTIECNWAIAYPLSDLADGLPENFKLATLINLSDLPVGRRVPLGPFADRVISESGWKWHSQDQSFVPMIKRHIIEKTVIDPMTRLGIVECGYRPHEIDSLSSNAVDTIRLTANGKSILTLFHSLFIATPSNPNDI